MLSILVPFLAVILSIRTVETVTVNGGGTFPVAGVGGGDPGGIGQCQPNFTPFHIGIATFAVSNMGPAYTLNYIRGFRVQVNVYFICKTPFYIFIVNMVYILECL